MLGCMEGEGKEVSFTLSMKNETIFNPAGCEAELPL
jgi:hypothetical protein